MTDECSLLVHANTPGACDWCGKTLTGRQTRWCSHAHSLEYMQQHRWSWARRESKRRAWWQCTREGCTERTHLEVNHIIPRMGAGYGFGCWNHLDNLETLCHDHHVEVTRQQREAK